MFFLKKLLTALCLPPLGPLLLAVLGLALLRRRRGLAKACIGSGLGALFLLSLPLVGNALLRTHESFPPLSANALARAQAIVVLGGGSYYAAPEYGGDTLGAASLERVRYAAWLYRHGPLPILVSGGAPFGGRAEAESMQQVLGGEYGVPVRWVETLSRDTAENAALSAPLLHQADVQRIVLVSHAWHLPRAKSAFEAQGFTVLPAPTAFTTASPSLFEELLPSGKALNNSRLALHEWLGRLLYRR